METNRASAVPAVIIYFQNRDPSPCQDRLLNTTASGGVYQLAIQSVAVAAIRFAVTALWKFYFHPVSVP
jgi:hypothetical protein